jgi:hypothetical protein
MTLLNKAAQAACEADAWGMARMREIAQSRAEFEARTDFAELVSGAARRGYRRITAPEQLDPGRVDAYAWRGGVWIKEAA